MKEQVMEQVMTGSVTIRFNLAGGEWRVVGSGPAKSHKDRVEEGETKQFIFLLTQDMIKRGYEFDTDDPIWVGEDVNQCPTSLPESGPISLVSKSESQVIVNDANPDPVLLRYQLNVLGPDGKPYPIDPIIDNRGGGRWN